MTPAEPAEKAQRLRQLHHASTPLLLPNVWDAASARLLEQMGFAAVATSSAAIANACGYPDGERIPVGEMLQAVARIACVVGVPVTADMEAGYARSPAAVHQIALQCIAAGVVGLNLEDSQAGARLLPIGVAVEKIAAVRAAATAAAVPLVINARTDAFFLKGELDFDPWDEALRRARAYRAAGADCVFLPGLTQLPLVARLLAATPGPINLLGGPGAPAVADLARAGVARISLGSGPYRAALGLLRRIASDLRAGGDYTRMAEYAIPYAEVNAWLAPER